MPADQAAGLRRRSAQQPLRCIHCYFDSAESTQKLALELHRSGWTSLLVDAGGRVFAGSSTRSLFGWRQQLARKQLQTLPMSYGEGWHAPGILADEPALSGLAKAYDAVVFDAALNGAGPDDSGLVLMPGALQAVVIETQAQTESIRRGYVLLKTLFHSGEPLGIGLLGDASACEQVISACAHFLDPRFAQTLFSAAREDDAFAGLAVRMAGAETVLRACR